VFLPLAFFSAAASGWIVRRSHPRPMVVIYAGFCVAASVVAFAVYAWLPIAERMPIPILTFFLAVDFIIGPLGVLAGGVWGSSGARDGLSASTLCSCSGQRPPHGHQRCQDRHGRIQLREQDVQGDSRVGWDRCSVPYFSPLL